MVDAVMTMGIIQQFFYNLRLVILQSLSCIMPFCRSRSPGYAAPSRTHINGKNRRQFEHVVGSIYGNFDPQTGIPLHQDIINDRHGKYTRKLKSVAKNRLHLLSKDSLMPDEYERDGDRHVFSHVSILNMVLGEKGTTGSSLSTCRKTGDEFCSVTKGHLSSDDADKEYSSSYNCGDKYTNRSCCKNRQGNSNSTRRISFEHSTSPSTSEDSNNECQLEANKSVIKNCGSPTKSNLRKLKLQIANDIEDSCPCDNNLCSKSNANGSKCHCINYISPTTSNNKLYKSQYKESAFDHYISPTSSRHSIHKIHCCSPTALLRKKKQPANSIDGATDPQTRLRLRKSFSSNTSEDDKPCPQTSTSKEINQRDRNVSPTVSKLKKNGSPKDPMDRPRGLKITIDKNFNSRTSVQVKSFPETSNNDDKYKRDHKFDPPNTKETNPPCGNYSSTNTSEEGGNEGPRMTPESKVKKNSNQGKKGDKSKGDKNDKDSSSTEENKFPKTCCPEAKHVCDHKFSPTKFKGNELIRTSSNSQDDECDCEMSCCGCAEETTEKNPITLCQIVEKTDTDDTDPIDDLESSDDKQTCCCRTRGLCNCGSSHRKNVLVKCSCNHENEESSDCTSEDVDSDNIKVPCTCSCQRRKELNIVYEHTLEGNAFPARDNRRYVSHISIEPFSNTESSNEERKSTSELTMDEKHGSDTNLTFECSCARSDSVRKLSSSRSSVSNIMSNCNICITDGRKLQIDENGHNTSIPKCVINHLIDHQVTFHIVKVCDDKK